MSDTYTESDVIDHLDEASNETDNQGQIVIYTGFFRWKDGTIRRTPDPNWDDGT